MVWAADERGEPNSSVFLPVRMKPYFSHIGCVGSAGHHIGSHCCLSTVITLFMNPLRKEGAAGEQVQPGKVDLQNWSSYRLPIVKTLLS